MIELSTAAGNGKQTNSPVCKTISIIRDRNSLNSAIDMLPKMKQSLSCIVLKKAATWWFSRTDRSLYRKARLEFDWMWKLFVVPEWS